MTALMPWQLEDVWRIRTAQEGICPVLVEITDDGAASYNPASHFDQFFDKDQLEKEQDSRLENVISSLS